MCHYKVRTDTKKLVEDCLKQDPRAQKTLYDTYAPMMLGVCMRYARSREAAEDTLHDAFVKVFAKLHTLRNEVALEDWIYHIVIHTAINNVKRERWHFEVFESESVELDYNPYDASELLEVIQTLPVAYRTVFNLREVEGYDYKEIAQVLKLNESSVRCILCRAKTMLKEKLTRHE